jgi:hypothetical protein
MKALSLSQPWDRVVLFPPYKDVENRSWPTSYRGRIYVHRAKSWDEKGYQWIMDSQLLSAEQMLGLAEIKQDYFGMKLRCQPGVAGEIDITRCMKKGVVASPSTPGAPGAGFGYSIPSVGDLHRELENMKTDCPEYFSRWFFGPYGFVLANPKAYAMVITYRGMPGLFEINSL